MRAAIRRVGAQLGKKRGTCVDVHDRTVGIGKLVTTLRVKGRTFINLQKRNQLFCLRALVDGEVPTRRARSKPRRDRWRVSRLL